MYNASTTLKGIALCDPRFKNECQFYARHKRERRQPF
jgi:hypothetical protein